MHPIQYSPEEIKERKRKRKEKAREYVISRFGLEPICYLTGEKVDWQNPKTYSLDHFIPRSKGGDNSLENMRVCCIQANLMKHVMSLREFVRTCSKIVYFQAQNQNIDYEI